MLRLALALPALFTASAAAQNAWRFEDIAVDSGHTLRVAIVEPDDFDPKTTYPVLLALPPGSQDRAMVEAGMQHYWGAQARRHGWVVVSPVAPAGRSFCDGGEDTLVGLLRWMRIHYTIEGLRIHLAGASNGGRSAFRVATLQAWQFASLTVLPGFPPAAEDEARLGQLVGLPVTMFVGGADKVWRQRSEHTAARLRALGGACTLHVLEGEGHAPPSLDGDAVLAHLETLRPRPADPAAPRTAIAQLLEDFHDAAAKADAERYFGCFSEDGVFLGTDATERWTVAEFRTWAARAFERDSAWIFVPGRRAIEVAPGGSVAWFDEDLGNAAFGACRGSGVVLLVDGTWRVAHYDLSVPIPNDLVYGVVDQIRAFADPAAKGTDTDIYVVRHAEKATAGKDPDLSPGGRVRARALAATLHDAGLTAIYTTSYRRNRETVAPIAKQSGLEPAVYQPRETGALVGLLRHHRGGTVLVCGHSNTVGPLLTALGCKGVAPLGESDYDDLFVVTLRAGREPLLRHLHYGAPDSGS